MGTITSAKRQESADIQHDIESYLAAGGKINILPSYVENDRQQAYAMDPVFRAGSVKASNERKMDMLRRMADSIKTAKWLPDGDLINAKGLAKRYRTKVRTMNGRILSGLHQFPQHVDKKAQEKFWRVVDIIDWEVEFVEYAKGL